MKTEEKIVDFNRVIFSIFVKFLVLVFLLSCCGWLIYNNTREITEQQLLLMCVKFIPRVRFMLLPENKERITFVMLTLLSVPFCIEVIYISGRLSSIKKWFEANLKPSGMISLNVFVSILIFFCLYRQGVDEQFMNVLFKPVWNCYFLIPLVLALTGFMIYAVFKWNFNRWNYGMSIFLLFFPLVQVFSCRLYSSLELVGNSIPDHSNIIAYAISQAAAGGFDYHQYGFYPRILAPIFRIISPDMLNISIVMAVLFIIACLSIYWVIFKNVKNKALVFGFAFIFFLSSGVWGFINVDKFPSGIEPYFAYYPIRFIFPALAVLFFYLQACSRKKYFIFICGILSGTSLWWNLDSGIAVAGALGAYMFLELVFSRTRPALIQFLSFLIPGVLTFILLLLVFSIQQGKIISPVASFKYIKLFSSSGFMMLPMPGPLAPWCFFAGIYLLGMIIGLRGFIAGRFSISAKMSLFLAILGIGLFTYYQGRSHAYNLLPVIWPALLLMFIYADGIIRLVRNGLVRKDFILLLVPAFFMSSCAIVTIAAGGKTLVSGVARTCRSLTSIEKPCQLEQDIKFIQANVNDRKEVNIIGKMQGVYYAETGLKAGIDNFNIIENLFIEDRKRVMRELYKAEVPLFIEQRAGRQLAPWVYQYYTLKAVNKDNSLYYFIPKSKGKRNKPQN